MSAEIAALSPSDVDAVLAKNYREQSLTQVRIALGEREIAGIIKRAGGEDKIDHQRQVSIDRLTDSIEKTRGELAELMEAAAPYEQRYRAERWTRAYLVTNVAGHVHNTTQCATCRSTTEFQWLTDLSGTDEDTIVEMAGERACTVCYPSAPVEVLNRPTQLFSDEEKAREERRAEREARKAEKDAKMLFDPRTGETLRGRYSEFKTERGAELEALDGLKSMLHYKGTGHPDMAEWADLARLVAFAKAAKHNTDAADEYATLVDKARKAHAREMKKYYPGSPIETDFPDGLDTYQEPNPLG